MRIGFDAHVLDGRDQGTKTLMLRLIERITENYPQHEVIVYSQNLHPEMPSKTNLRHRATPHRGAVWHLLVTLPRAQKTDRLDTMVYNFISSPITPKATTLIHDVLPQTHSRFFSKSFVARCWVFFGLSAFTARYILTISESSRDQIKRIYPWTRRKRIGVLHCGPSFSENVYFDAGGASHSDTVSDLGSYALCVGRIEPRKNIQLAIDAFRAGAPADTKLLIVGRREPGTEIDKYGDVRIIELQNIGDTELANLYRRAALFLYPSAAEGFGLPLLDAILFGIPTISSRSTSMAEVGGECVEFFDPCSADALNWLSTRIAAHFRDRPVAAPSPAQRHERLRKYSWGRAASELVSHIEMGQGS